MTKTNLYSYDYILKPNPDAYIAFTQKRKETKRYFLDIFDELPPRMMLRKRVRQYFNYYDKEYWQKNHKGAFPKIILICPDEKSKRYLYRFIQKKLANENELLFFLTTKDQIKKKGLIADILQEVEIKE